MENKIVVCFCTIIEYVILCTSVVLVYQSQSIVEESRTTFNSEKRSEGTFLYGTDDGLVVRELKMSSFTCASTDSEWLQNLETVTHQETSVFKQNHETPISPPAWKI